jgi:hypothetical protein
MLGFAPLAATPLGAGAPSAGSLVALLATENPDVAAFVANNQNVYFAVTEATDVAAFEVNSYAFIYLETTEEPDTAAFVVWNTNVELAATEAPDIAAFVASMTGTVSMAAIEAPDGYSQNAYILWLTPTQPDDPTIWVPKNDPAPYLTTVI